MSFYAICCMGKRTVAEIARAMVDDAIHFYRRDMHTFITESLAGDKELITNNSQVLMAWKE